MAVGPLFLLKNLF